MVKKTITYSINDMKKLNKYVLRTIPNSEKYSKFLSFINDDNKKNLSKVIKKPVVPPYLKNRYADIKQNNNSNIFRGNNKDQREMTRKKLYLIKDETPEDKVNESVRSILTKLSETNKTKLFADFQKLEITDECGQTLVDNIYLFAVDLDYLVDVYVELIILLKKKNAFLYDQLIQKILSLAFEPLNFNDEENGVAKTKRWRLANIKLVSGIYKKDSTKISFATIKSIIESLYSQINPTQPDSLEILCELLKSNQCQLITQNKNFTEQLIGQLETFCQNKKYDLRYRFMVQDLLEIYNCDSEDND